MERDDVGHTGYVLFQLCWGEGISESEQRRYAVSLMTHAGGKEKQPWSDPILPPPAPSTPHRVPLH